MAEFVSLLQPCYRLDCLQSIVFSPSFFDVIYSSSIANNRQIMEFFADKADDGICTIIDSQKALVRKTALLRLLYRKLDMKSVRKYKSLLSKHILELDHNTLYTSVFAKWIKPTNRFVEHLLSDIVSLYNRDEAISVMPNPLEIKIEMALIFFMAGYIENLDSIEALSIDYPVLDFFVHPESFDYSKVDFSNYMWQNVARRERFMRIIVEHKDAIKPRILQRMRLGDATEIEKKILYSMLLEKDELWNLDD